MNASMMWVVAGLLAVQSGALLWMAFKLRAVGRAQARIGRLADAIVMLTDTTEAGLATLVREIEQLGKRRTPPRAASRSSIARRVADAAGRGDDPVRIASRESLSESEVRLHLALVESDLSQDARDGALRA